jgi:hypothetical protein
LRIGRGSTVEACGATCDRCKGATARPAGESRFYGDSRADGGQCPTTGLNTHSPPPLVPLGYMRALRVMGQLATRLDARSAVMSEAIGQ